MPFVYNPRVFMDREHDGTDGAGHEMESGTLDDSLEFGDLMADEEFDNVRGDHSDPVHTEVIILFSDIQGSTAYFERNGDVEGLAMVQHHNDLAFPVIEGEGGRVVKTIGDAIMACFKDPVSAIRAA